MNCQVNKNLLPIKLFYLWFYAAVASIGPYMPHFLQQKGFSSVDVSTILGIVPFLIIFSKPTIGHFADKSERYKLTTICCLITGGLFLSLLYFIHVVNDNETFLDDLSNNSSLKEILISLNDTLSVKKLVSNKTHFLTYQFWFTMGLIIIANAFGLSPSYTIVDTLTMNILKKRPQDFGKQRMWMSVGLASAIFSVSAIMDSISDGSGTVNYLPSFISFLFCIFVSCVSVVFIQPVKNEKKTINKGLKSFLPILKNWKVLLFMFMTFVLGMNFGKSTWMTVWYMKELGAKQLTIALSVTLTSTTTMISSFFSGLIIRKIGHELSLCLCMTCYAIRCWLWLLISNPWHGIANELLTGVAIGLWFSTMVSYANKISPKGSETSGQSVLSGVYDGLGTGIGNLSSGWLYFWFGGFNTWRVFGVFTSLCAIVYFIIVMCTHRPTCRAQTKDIGGKELVVLEKKPLKGDDQEREGI